MIGETLFKAAFDVRAPLRHRIGIGLGQEGEGELVGAAPDGAKQRPFA